LEVTAGFAHQQLGAFGVVAGVAARVAARDVLQ
jgi:hypothetical protein